MNVVLFEPEIAWNTGNIGRTCVAAGAALHLIEPLGFKISERQIRRAGLDYWPRLKLHMHQDFESFHATLPPKAALFAFAGDASATFWEAPYSADATSAGSDPRLRKDHRPLRGLLSHPDG